MLLKARKKTLEFELEALVNKHASMSSNIQYSEHIVHVSQRESHYYKLSASHTAW